MFAETGYLVKSRKAKLQPKTMDNKTLLDAVEEGNTQSVNKHLQNDDINVNTTQDGTRDTPLIIASEKGYVDIVSLLLAHHADITSQNVTGATAVHAAAASDHVDIIDLLHKSGSNLNAINSAGISPLHVAVQKGYIRCVKCLLRLGVDNNICDITWHRTPLYDAVKRGDFRMAQMLLGKDAEANIQDTTGSTPLHEAVADNNLHMARLLLKHGADINIREHITGVSPLDEAKSSEMKQLLTIFVQKASRDSLRARKYSSGSDSGAHSLTGSRENISILGERRSYHGSHENLLGGYMLSLPSSMSLTDSAEYDTAFEGYKVKHSERKAKRSASLEDLHRSSQKGVSSKPKRAVRRASYFASTESLPDSQKPWKSSKPGMYYSASIAGDGSDMIDAPIRGNMIFVSRDPLPKLSKRYSNRFGKLDSDMGISKRSRSLDDMSSVGKMWKSSPKASAKEKNRSLQRFHSREYIEPSFKTVDTRFEYSTSRTKSFNDEWKHDPLYLNDRDFQRQEHVHDNKMQIDFGGSDSNINITHMETQKVVSTHNHANVHDTLIITRDINENGSETLDNLESHADTSVIQDKQSNQNGENDNSSSSGNNEANDDIKKIDSELGSGMMSKAELVYNYLHEGNMVDQSANEHVSPNQVTETVLDIENNITHKITTTTDFVQQEQINISDNMEKLHPLDVNESNKQDINVDDDERKNNVGITNVDESINNVKLTNVDVDERIDLIKDQSIVSDLNEIEAQVSDKTQEEVDSVYDESIKQQQLECQLISLNSNGDNESIVIWSDTKDEVSEDINISHNKIKIEATLCDETNSIDPLYSFGLDDENQNLNPIISKSNISEKTCLEIEQVMEQIPLGTDSTDTMLSDIEICLSVKPNEERIPVCSETIVSEVDTQLISFEGDENNDSVHGSNNDNASYADADSYLVNGDSTVSQSQTILTCNEDSTNSNIATDGIVDLFHTVPTSSSMSSNNANADLLLLDLTDDNISQISDTGNAQVEDKNILSFEKDENEKQLKEKQKDDLEEICKSITMNKEEIHSIIMLHDTLQENVNDLHLNTHEEIVKSGEVNVVLTAENPGTQELSLSNRDEIHEIIMEHDGQKISDDSNIQDTMGSTQVSDTNSVNLSNNYSQDTSNDLLFIHGKDNQDSFTLADIVSAEGKTISHLSHEDGIDSVQADSELKDEHILVTNQVSIVVNANIMDAVLESEPEHAIGTIQHIKPEYQCNVDSLIYPVSETIMVEGLVSDFTDDNILKITDTGNTQVENKNSWLLEKEEYDTQLDQKQRDDLEEINKSYTMNTEDIIMLHDDLRKNADDLHLDTHEDIMKSGEVNVVLTAENPGTQELSLSKRDEIHEIIMEHDGHRINDDIKKQDTLGSSPVADTNCVNLCNNDSHDTMNDLLNIGGEENQVSFTLIDIVSAEDKTISNLSYEEEIDSVIEDSELKDEHILVTNQVSIVVNTKIKNTMLETEPEHPTGAIQHLQYDHACNGDTLLDPVCETIMKDGVVSESSDGSKSEISIFDHIQPVTDFENTIDEDLTLADIVLDNESEIQESVLDKTPCSTIEADYLPDTKDAIVMNHDFVLGKIPQGGHIVDAYLHTDHPVDEDIAVSNKTKTIVAETPQTANIVDTSLSRAQTVVKDSAASIKPENILADTETSKHMADAKTFENIVNLLDNTAFSNLLTVTDNDQLLSYDTVTSNSITDDSLKQNISDDELCPTVNTKDVVVLQYGDIVDAENNDSSIDGLGIPDQSLEQGQMENNMLIANNNNMLIDQGVSTSTGEYANIMTEQHKSTEFYEIKDNVGDLQSKHILHDIHTEEGKSVQFGINDIADALSKDIVQDVQTPKMVDTDICIEGNGAETTVDGVDGVKIALNTNLTEYHFEHIAATDKNEVESGITQNQLFSDIDFEAPELRKELPAVLDKIVVCDKDLVVEEKVQGLVQTGFSDRNDIHNIVMHHDCPDINSCLLPLKQQQGGIDNNNDMDKLSAETPKSEISGNIRIGSPDQINHTQREQFNSPEVKTEKEQLKSPVKQYDNYGAFDNDGYENRDKIDLEFGLQDTRLIESENNKFPVDVETNPTLSEEILSKHNLESSQLRQQKYHYEFFNQAFDNADSDVTDKLSDISERTEVSMAGEEDIVKSKSTDSFTVEKFDIAEGKSSMDASDYMGKHNGNSGNRRRTKEQPSFWRKIFGCCIGDTTNIM